MRKGRDGEKNEKENQKLISQAKIDRLYEQKVVQKPSELGVVVKMVNPVMILKKTCVENEPWIVLIQSMIRGLSWQQIN